MRWLMLGNYLQIDAFGNTRSNIDWFREWPKCFSLRTRKVRCNISSRNYSCSIIICLSSLFQSKQHSLVSIFSHQMQKYSSFKDLIKDTVCEYEWKQKEETLPSTWRHLNPWPAGWCYDLTATTTALWHSTFLFSVVEWNKSIESLNSFTPERNENF